MQATLNVVESYRRARLVDGVTSDDDKPAAVYKLDEICDLLIDSGSDVVKEISDYVAQRFENSSPYVKQKALRLVKYALPRTTPQFRREIQRHSGTMKALFHFRAPPDPLKGDAPSKAVREAAHETVHALFNPEPPQGRMARGGGAGAGSGGGMEGRRMEGFGNTAPPRSGGSSGPAGWGSAGAGSGQSGFGGMVGYGSEALQQGLSMLSGGSTKKPQSSSFDNPGDQRGAYRGPSIHDTMGSAGGWRDSGGGRDFGEDYGRRERDYGRDREYGHYREDSKQQEYAPQGGDHGGHGVHSNGYPEQGAVNVGRGEESPAVQAAQLVESVTTGGGVRVQPSREALQEFVNRAERMGGEDIAQALEWRLSDSNWQVKMKSLCVLEAMLRRAEDGSSSVCAAVKRIFGESPFAVETCLDSPQQSVRDKSRRVLDLLGASSGSTGPPPVATSTSQPDLIPDLLDTTDSTPSAVPPQAQAQAQGGLLDLLGGENDAPAPATAAQPAMPASSSTGFGSTASDGGGGSLFEGLSVEESIHQSAHTSQQSPVPAPQDPFAGVSAVNPGVVHTAPSQAQTGASGVGDLLGEDVDNLFEGLKVSEGAAAAAASGGGAPKVAQAAGSAKVDKSSILSAYTTTTPLVPTGPVPGMFPGGMPAMGMPGAVPMGMAGGATWQQQQQMALAMQMQMLQMQRGAAGMPGGVQPGMAGFGVPGFGGGGHKGPQMDQFDFSGPSQMPAPIPSSTGSTKKEDVAAFDFVSGHLQAARSGKKPGLV